MAINQLLNAKIDIPLPKVVSLGVHGSHRYMLREMVVGKTLKESIEEGQSPGKLFYQAGQILAKIHTIGFETRGLLRPDMTVMDYGIFTNSEYGFILNGLLKNQALSQGDYSRLQTINIDRYYMGQNVLCHCDYNGNNILVKDNNIVAVLDFEWAGSCPFMDDTASFDLMAQLNGYNRDIDKFYEGYDSIKEII